MNNRFQTRRLDAYNLTGSRHAGDFLDIALVHETPTHLAAMATRLSHESHALSSPERDVSLLGRMIASGEEHEKGLRGKLYYLMIEAPRYWWVEMDTYTVGVISMGSTSTMHKEAKGLKGAELVAAKSALPEGTLQLRMKAVSHLTLRRIVAQRLHHRLPEWQEFCTFTLPLLDL